MIVRISADLTPTGVTAASSLDAARNHPSGILMLQEHLSGILKYRLISSHAFAGMKVHVDHPGRLQAFVVLRLWTGWRLGGRRTLTRCFS